MDYWQPPTQVPGRTATVPKTAPPAGCIWQPAQPTPFPANPRSIGPLIMNRAALDEAVKQDLRYAMQLGRIQAFEAGQRRTVYVAVGVVRRTPAQQEAMDKAGDVSSPGHYVAPQSTPPSSPGATQAGVDNQSALSNGKTGAMAGGAVLAALAVAALLAILAGRKGR